jgi:DNA-binding MarR family transcriptional regulator
MSKSMYPNVSQDFLVQLRKIDLRSLTVRDVLVLYVVMKSPGLSGVDVANKLGIADRSSIASNIQRLEREGYIEDRRIERRKAIPAVLHIKPAGVAFWDEIKP